MNITRPQYDGLISAALSGDLQEVRRIQQLVDAENNIRRYYLSIRWQDVGGQPPRRIELGVGWPAEESFLMESDVPISKENVLDLISKKASNPVTILVTPDRAGVVGWSRIDDYRF